MFVQRIQVCSRRILIISLHVHIACESVYSSSSAVKQTSETLRKNIIRYLCFISVDFIHSRLHRLKKSNFILEKNKFRSTDLTCWRSTINHCVAILNCLEYEFLKGFWSKGDSSHFENPPSFQISWTYSDVFEINEKFIHNCPPCLLAEMAKVASSVARPRKCYINRLERCI